MSKKALYLSAAGFTLVEMIAVIMIISILALIAAPGWLGFMNSRRAEAGREQILQFLRQAQSQATQTRQQQVVNFIAPANQLPSVEIGGISQPLTGQMTGAGSNPRMYRLTVSPNAKSTLCSANAIGCIAFDDRGNVISDDLGEGIAISVTSPISNTNGDARRCVIVKSLLGAMQNGKGDACDP